MSGHAESPRILVVTPEITYLPVGMDDACDGMNAKAGGLADVSAALIQALYNQGADVHVALPDYRTIFPGREFPPMRRRLRALQADISVERVHLAQDRAFFYLDQVYSGNQAENMKIALAFQREVINHILPKVGPDLIHCNDWMTGLIPATARRMDIPCLFTIHNIHTAKTTLAHIEDRGIDAAAFWQNLYYSEFPGSYEYTRTRIPADFLLSGVFAAHFINTVSPRFLVEVIDGRHAFVSSALKQELSAKHDAGCAAGILNSPDPSYDPSCDGSLACHYTPETHVTGKRLNKLALQKRVGLKPSPWAPLFFWPSRLDPVQKGCDLLAEVFEGVLSRGKDLSLQIVFVADGAYGDRFREFVRTHPAGGRVAVCGFDDALSHLAYAASDFVLMPSRFEPCGLPQMIGTLYGALPIAHDTGGLHDTVSHLDLYRRSGNGFVFKTFDGGGLLWAVDQALSFYRLPPLEKERRVRRVMAESARRFNHQVTARQYIALYERMLKRPLVQMIPDEADEAGEPVDVTGDGAPTGVATVADLRKRRRRKYAAASHRDRSVA